MWWLISTIFLTDLLIGNGRNLKEKKVRKKIIQIQKHVQQVQGQYQEHYRDRDRIRHSESNNIITYSLDVCYQKR